MIGSVINSMFTPDGPTINPNYQGPKREWVGLTGEDMNCLFPHGSNVWVQETVKIIEAKLKEKNE